MTDTTTVREPSDGDVARIREIADSTLTASYALSPQQLDGIVEARFGEDQIREWIGRDDVVALVAEVEGPDGDRRVAGVVEGTVDGDTGTVRWLFVDPELQGRGAGTALFEAVREHLRDRGVDRVRANTLEANTEGHQFFESFDFEQVSERDLTIGEEEFVEYVYGEADEEAETDADTDARDDETTSFPDTERTDGTRRATTEDGETVFVDDEDGRSGTVGAFFPAYSDESFDERFGFYCSNCGSLQTAMDNEERVECTECGNTHEPRSSEAYDDAYL
ncbi:GNAT family N-acetyltransferase [Halomarina litorea]|uniref:GNAT family N-acetyltransferase n=1 Tax=Halomarina litorea TaxID=2961595 RepID=UPI0020C2555B|nr:GNAT family N-acetyltransferase [Halomarina sp. BCD28]